MSTDRKHTGFCPQPLTHYPRGADYLKASLCRWRRTHRIEPPKNPGRFNSDQPYYCEDAESVYKLLSAIRRDPMCEVMEVYDLSVDREVQLGERRAWHLPDVSEASDEPEFPDVPEAESASKLEAESESGATPCFICLDSLKYEDKRIVVTNVGYRA